MEHSNNGVMMVQLDLNSDEQAILLEILQTAFSDLRMEIANTDSQDFREQLKLRKAVVEKALAALTA
jgi:hypothetical protein